MGQYELLPYAIIACSTASEKPNKYNNRLPVDLPATKKEPRLLVIESQGSR